MVDELLKSALEGLGASVTRFIYKGDNDTFITFQRLLSLPTAFADDESTATRHVYRVDIFTTGDHAELMERAVAALKQNGFTVASVDPETREERQGRAALNHVPVTVNYLEE